MKIKGFLITLLLLFFFQACTIVYDKDLEQIENSALTIESRAGKIWNDTVISFIKNEGLPIDDAINHLESDSSLTYFPVKDQVTILSSHLESKSRFLLCNTSENTEVKIQLGPIIKGTAIRDSNPGIQADDFVNQIEFAALSRELNKLAGNEADKYLIRHTSPAGKINIEGILTSKEENMITITSIQAQGD
jgi:predicted lipoprotein